MVDSPAPRLHAKIRAPPPDLSVAFQSWVVRHPATGGCLAVSELLSRVPRFSRRRRGAQHALHAACTASPTMAASGTVAMTTMSASGSGDGAGATAAATSAERSRKKIERCAMKATAPVAGSRYGMRLAWRTKKRSESSRKSASCEAGCSSSSRISDVKQS